jgi:hypothetical protein
MLIVAASICGLVFGWGLLISGMVQPAKVLAFLDIFRCSIRDKSVPRGRKMDPKLAARRQRHEVSYLARKYRVEE